MQNLYAVGMTHSLVIAVPSVRLRAHFSTDFGDTDLRTGLAAILETFMEAFEPEIGSVALEKASEGNLRVHKRTKANFAKAYAAVEAGLGPLRAVSFAGPLDSEGPSRLPFLRASHLPVPADLRADYSPFSGIAIDLPAEHPRGLPTLEAVDRILRTLPTFAGSMGLGFSMANPHNLSFRSLPSAHLRYRCALMSDDHPFSRVVRYSEPWVISRRERQRARAHPAVIPEDQLFDYTPGLPDVGWRTYVGGDFRARLEGTAPSGLDVQTHGGLMVLTAGPAPIWGDLNADEDISLYRQAYGFLEPALASREARVLHAPGYSKRDTNAVRDAEAYVDRFKPKNEETF
ncbi:MAG: hypothetical protein ACU0CI_02750 [Shimia sp.]